MVRGLEGPDLEAAGLAAMVQAVGDSAAWAALGIWVAAGLAGLVGLVVGRARAGEAKEVGLEEEKAEVLVAAAGAAERAPGD